MRGHLAPRDLQLNKIGKKTSRQMLHIKFKASKPSGSEEEDFLIFFYIFLWFEPRTPWRGAILDPGTFI